MNAITTVNQFLADAPASVRFDGRTFKYSRALVDGDATDAKSVRFDFTARKRRGAFLGDKLSAVVTYDRGSDLYNVEIIHFDGDSFDSNTLGQYDGIYSDGFSACLAVACR